MMYDYMDPKPATWPEADFIVGNPPFIGDKAMRTALGDGYVDALRRAYKGIVPESADFVMFWWHKAAEIVRANKAERFGFITTNSIKQTFNRRVIQTHMEEKEPISIVYAIPDHPWVDSTDGAAVRIALTVAKFGTSLGRVDKVISEVPDGIEGKVTFSEKSGKINSDLTLGADLTSTAVLASNSNITSVGMGLYGAGFLVRLEEAKVLGLGEIPYLEEYIKPYLNGKDLTQTSRGYYVIDLYGLPESDVRQKFPKVYQHVLNTVKPERDQNNRASYKKNWLWFGEPRAMLREALKGLSSYIATCRTAKHRTFSFLDSSVIPDAKIVAIALDDYFHLGILSSKVHVTWAMATGAWLGVGNDSNYNHSECFLKFPFPVCTDMEAKRVRIIAEQLNSHRKEQQAQNPTLTLTDIYNVLEKLRSGEALTAKEQKVHEQGLVSILKQLHDELDAAVAAAYGWPANLAEEEILVRLVALNKERAAEEARGLVRWLRPEYQNPQGVQQTGIEMETPEEEAAKEPDGVLVPWPRTLAEQAQAVQRALQLQERPVTAEDLYRHFKPVSKGQMAQRVQQIESLLQTLQGLGLLRRTEGGMYVK